MVTGNKLRGTLDSLSLLIGLVYLDCSSNQRMSRERLPAVGGCCRTAILAWPLHISFLSGSLLRSNWSDELLAAVP